MCLLGCMRQVKESVLHNRVGNHNDLKLCTPAILHLGPETNYKPVENRKTSTSENLLTNDKIEKHSNIPVVTANEAIINHYCTKTKIVNAIPQGEVVKIHRLSDRRKCNVLDNDENNSSHKLGSTSSSDASHNEGVLQYFTRFIIPF